MCGEVLFTQLKSRQVLQTRHHFTLIFHKCSACIKLSNQPLHIARVRASHAHLPVPCDGLGFLAAHPGLGQTGTACPGGRGRRLVGGGHAAGPP